MQQQNCVICIALSRGPATTVCDVGRVYGNYFNYAIYSGNDPRYIDIVLDMIQAAREHA